MKEPVSRMRDRNEKERKRKYSEDLNTRQVWL